MLDRVLSAVTTVTGVSEDLLKSNLKHRRFYLARRLAMFVLHTDHMVNNKYLARHFRRDHSTVSHALSDAWDLYEARDPQFMENLAKVRHLIVRKRMAEEQR